MRVRRRIVCTGLASALAMPALVRFPAGAAEFSLKFGSDEVPTHVNAVRAQQASDQIAQETNGRVEVKFFPGNVLGSGVAMLAQLRTGALEMLQIGDNVLSSVVPVVGISSVPFAFSSGEQACSTIDGPLGAYIRGVIAKADMYAFERCWDASMREISNNVRPIAVPADLKGLKIRIPESPVTVAVFRALGASPVPIPAKDVYASLQTHLVDGMEAGLDGIETYKWSEVLKYISLTNHAWLGYKILANGAVWQRLPKNLRDVVEKNVNAAAMLERADAARGDANLEATLKKQGLIFNQPDGAPFRAIVRAAGVYTQLRDSLGQQPWDLLEKAVGKLT